ncbi:oxepin-CoA hydrolase, alternative type [Amorphus sp. 3PC139-8]|uniref:oxepin-CoA hydrolase, alternative type n=1 Tax=Amorphus sp. 3PC139-8 TaxID=2735676 RepID=UPI00345CE947
MSSATIVRSETRVEDGIRILTLDGPETRNSIGPAQYDALRAAIVDAGADVSLRAIVLHGVGGFFSSGGNVHALTESRAKPRSEAFRNTDLLGGLILAIRACPIPVIAAVEGGAAGLGLALALSCDMIAASAEAKFTAAYVRIGLTPDGGTTYFLREALPRQLVSEMCMLGRTLSAERLYAAGVVNVLTAEGGAQAAALELASACAGGAPEAIAVIKHEIEAVPANSLASQLELEAHGINTARFGEEAGEGLQAFLEKRRPRFPGRTD